MRSWLLTILRNTCYTWLHRNRRPDTTELFDEEIHSPEVSGGAGLHFVVSISGILIMSGAAWLFSWYKHSADKSASRTRSTIGNADMAGGSL